MPAVVLAAPAKLNLDLRIVGRRTDGYQELRTIFQSLALHDIVTVRERRGPMRVRSRSRLVPPDERNLVWTAAQALWEALGREGKPAGVSLTIRKVIPIGGGLGGGSSDAAAALRGLVTLWGTPGRRGLVEVAARVGSDVPYLLTGGTALGTGRGDEIRPIRELRPLWVVLAAPRFGVSSASAYRWLRERGGVPGADALPRGWRRRLAGLRNDLEPPVSARHPEIMEMVARLRRSGAVHAAMTGSGSTVFGLFERRASAASARLAVRAPGWRTILTRTTDRASFRRLCDPCPASSVLPAP